MRIRKMTEREMIRLLDRVESELRRRFLAMVADMRARHTIDELAAMIETGRLEQALAAVERSVLVFANAGAGSYILAGQRAAVWMSNRLDEVVSFDQTNERAVRWMREQRLRRIREMGDETRGAIRTALTEGIERGANPIEQARTFRGTLGLTRRQVAAVNNFRRLLQEGSEDALTRRLRDRRFDRTLRRAIDGEPLSSEQIERMVQRYRERYIKYRSEVIARTEALRSVHEGTEEAFRQAIDDGRLEAESLVREWHPARVPKWRDSHKVMRGQKRPFGQPFTSGAGVSLRYPGDMRAPASETISCRCAVSTRIVQAAA